MTFKLWIRNHKRETILGSVILLLGISGIAILIYFNMESPEQSKLSKSDKGSESSLSSSGGGFDSPDGLASSPGGKKGHKSGRKIKTKSPEVGKQPSSKSPKVDGLEAKLPDGSPEHKGKTKTPSSSSDLPENPKTEEELKKALKQSETSNEPIDFCSTLDSFKKATENFKFLQPPENKPPAAGTMPPSTDNYKAHVTQILSQNSLLSTSNADTPFDKAHKKVVALLIDALIKGSSDATDLRNLENFAVAAKQEAQNVSYPNPRAEFFRGNKVDPIKNFLPNFLFLTNFFVKTINAFLYHGISSPEFKTSLELVYHSCHLLQIFLISGSWPGPEITFNSFNEEFDDLCKQLFKSSAFRNHFAYRLNDIYKSPSDVKAAQKLIDVWKASNTFPAPKDDIYRTLPKVTVFHVKDIESSKEFCYQTYVNILLESHFVSFSIEMNKLNDTYSVVRSFSGAATIPEFSKNFVDVVKFYSPDPVFPPTSLVLPSPPNRFSASTFAGSLFQSLVNFQPLFQSLGVFRLPNLGPFAQNVLGLMNKLSTQNISSVDFELGTFRNIGHIFAEFKNSFPDQGLQLAKVCGFFENSDYFPPLLSKIGINMQTDMSRIKMLGPLFIYSFGTAQGQSYPDPDDISLELSLSVLGVKEKKWYELYSIAFGIVPNSTVSYVKRGNGKWYKTIYNEDSTEVDVSSIPLSKSQYSATFSPLMAFYLRTEA